MTLLLSDMKEITLKKEIKIGQPNYSNTTIGMNITWDVDEEGFDFEEAWDLINQQLNIQASSNLDPAWIQQKEHKGFYKTTVKVPKVVRSNGK